MKREWLLFVAFGLFVTAAAADDNAAKADKEKIQGTWSVVTIQNRGSASSPGRAADCSPG